MRKSRRRYQFATCALRWDWWQFEFGWRLRTIEFDHRHWCKKQYTFAILIFFSSFEITWRRNWKPGERANAQMDQMLASME